MPKTTGTGKADDASDLADKRLKNPASFIAPWPEWDDRLVNATKWDPSVNPTPSSKLQSKQVKLQVTEVLPDICFEEPNNHGVLPPSMPEVEWKRPSVVNKDTAYVIEPESYPLKLLQRNFHLFPFKIIREILSSVMSLEVAGKLNPFPMDYQSDNYLANGGNEWKPWHHVYAMTKAGRGQIHQPKYNRFGLYYVRLFYMGKWRQITVDDFLPYDSFGQLLLPVSDIENNLWLPILTKALLRIASLSWTSTNDINDFSVIGCLTGWLCNSVDCLPSEKEDLWYILWNHIILQKEDDKVDPLQCCAASSKTSCINEKILMLPNKPVTEYLFAEIPETSQAGDMPNISPNHSHLAYLFDLKEEQNYIEPYPKWKVYRWIDWSVKNGRIKIEDYIPKLTREIEMYSPFQLTLMRPHKLQKFLVALKEEDPNFIWLDYDYFMKYIRTIHVYYSRSHFTNSVGLYDIQNSLLPPVKGGSNLPKFPAEYFYIYCDSAHCKNLFITLSVISISSELTADYLLCELYNWRTSALGPLMFSLHTKGTKTFNLILPPGRRVCRIWYQLKNEYYILINSRSQFSLQPKEHIHELLVNESVSSNLFADEMKSCFMKLLECENGSQEHIERLSKFQTSFYPPYYIMKKKEYYEADTSSYDLYSVFEECLMELLLENEHSLEKLGEYILGLQNLFLNPNFGENYLEETDREAYDYITAKKLALEQERILENTTKNNMKAKAGKEKKTAKTKSGGNDAKRGSAPKTTYLLESINSNLQLLEKIVRKKEGLIELYPFKHDLDMKLQYYDYKGVTKDIVGKDWILVARLIVNIHSNTPVPCGIMLFSNLNSVALTVYNVATFKEIPCRFAPNGVYELTKNEKGYAVIVYGYPNNESNLSLKEVTWTLRILGINQSNILHECTGTEGQLCSSVCKPPLPLSTSILSGCYFPNKFNVVSRFLIKITKTEIVTLNFSVTNNLAKIHLSFRGNDSSIVELDGVGRIVVPSMILTMDAAVKDESGVLYYVGIVTVDSDSWPVSKEELSILVQLRHLSKDTVAAQRSSLKQGGKPKGSVVSKTALVDGPKWTLSVITNLQKTGGGVTLLPDKRARERFLEQQAEWEKLDPGRLERGIEMRNDYIEAVKAAELYESEGLFRSIYELRMASILSFELDIDPVKTRILLGVYRLAPDELPPTIPYISEVEEYESEFIEGETKSGEIESVGSASFLTSAVLNKQVFVDKLLDLKCFQVQPVLCGIILFSSWNTLALTVYAVATFKEIPCRFVPNGVWGLTKSEIQVQPNF